MVESKYAMVTPEVALDTVLRHTPVLASEVVSLTEAGGRVLAEDMVAEEDMPSFASSAVDGFAVLSSDSSPLRGIAGDVVAGQAERASVAPGTAVRTMTGAPVAAGADAVVMVEFTEEQGGKVRLTHPVGPGENVIPPGTDVKAGQTVLRRGIPLGAPEIGLLAALGWRDVRVFRQPRVAVLSTGDELVEPWEKTGPAQIRDSNRHALMAAVRSAGGIPASLGMVKDVLEDQRGKIRDGLAAGDVLITSGGVSMGVRDLVKGILEEAGVVHFGRVSMKPGKPLTFASIGNKLAFGLPGFPVSSLVTFELYVRPSLLKMQGHRQPTRPRVEVILDHDVKPAMDRTEFQRAMVRWENGALRAKTTGAQTSSRLLSMVGANALLVFPPSGERRAGERVTAILTGAIT